MWFESIIESLPEPLGTLPRTLSHAAYSPGAFLAVASDPFHLPLAMTLAIIPFVYALGLVSGNVSWVDRIWTTWPLLSTASIIAWVFVHPGGGVYGPSLPRLFIVATLQVIWSVRLTRHTARRGFYSASSQDYRYTYIKPLLPPVVWELTHLFAVALMQPLLLVSLNLPTATIIQPASNLSAGPVPALALPFWAVQWLFPTRFRVAPNTPVLNVLDFLLIALGLGAVYIEATADNAMYAFQTAKHAQMKDERSVPPAYYPGFPIQGVYAWSRHANFAAEQSFWLIQGLFVVSACVSPRLGAALGPPFALSILFCTSTALTEWITTRKYPVYKSYSQLVGKFLPQETVLKWMWTAVRGTWPRLEGEVYKRGSELYQKSLNSGSDLKSDLRGSNIPGLPRRSA